MSHQNSNYKACDRRQPQRRIHMQEYFGEGRVCVCGGGGGAVYNVKVGYTKLCWKESAKCIKCINILHRQNIFRGISKM